MVTPVDTETAAREPQTPEREARGDLSPRLDSPEEGPAQDAALSQAARRIELKQAVAVGFPVVGAAVMVGGVFIGISPRAYAAIAGLMGIAIAVGARRIRSPMGSNALVLGGLFAVGLVMMLTGGPNNLFNLRKLVGEAAASGDVLRPPVPFVIGWRAILGWLMAIVGFGAGWVGFGLRRIHLGLLLPLTFSALVAFSVPKNAQIASGLILLLSFLAGLRLASFTAEAEQGHPLPAAYQLRVAMRSLPLMAGATVALLFLSRVDFLFPPPMIDPAQEPQKPKTTPLSEVEDRVLFEVKSEVTGPWRIGGLDVYDGQDWRLPPFAQAQLKEVPESGVVDPDLQPQIEASFKVAGLQGAVLPGLPNTVGIRAFGPLLAYDSRNGNIRLVQGQAEPGLVYDVLAPALPSVSDLRAPFSIPPEVQKFTEIPKPPLAVLDLIALAPKASKWDEFDYLRTYVLDNVIATGSGTPKSVTPERVADMLAGSRQGSPFEIVAAQAMLARWVGLPSRIGYGFDGGDPAGEGKLEVRPRHGATFPEVYFRGFKWLPVIGVPRKAQASTSDSDRQIDPTVLPSEDIAVSLKLPVLTPPESITGKQVQRIVVIVVPSLLLLILLYTLYPAVVKAVRRSQARAAATADGPKARISQAYREWRDTCTDFACGSSTDTPLMFLERFPRDDEHEELAWLSTRTLWGDLQDECTEDLALAAEELSRTLRRRLSMAHPATMRAISMVSRLSLRRPFGEDQVIHSLRRPRIVSTSDRVQVGV